MTTSEMHVARSASGGGLESFATFLKRVRQGDQTAAVELVNRFEPSLQLEIRLRLGDPQLRRLFEPHDISQSVLGSFFARMASGQFELESPERLLGLLIVMARNKIALKVQKYRTLRRNIKREVSLDAEPGECAAVARGPSPSRMMMGRETLEGLRKSLSSDEWRIAEFRMQGRSWSEIAEELGGTPQSRRKQLSRAVRQAVRDSGEREAADE